MLGACTGEFSKQKIFCLSKSKRLALIMIPDPVYPSCFIILLQIVVTPECRSKCLLGFGFFCNDNKTGHLKFKKSVTFND